MRESIMSDESNIKIRMNAAAGVIVRENEDGVKQVLLIQRAVKDHWPHHWEFPRGKCDHGNEDIRVCAKREIKEETGLDVKIIGLIDKFQYLADAGTRLTTCFNFLCEMENPNQKIKLSKEHQDYKWISEVGQAELLVLPEQKRTITKVLNRERPIVADAYKGDNKMLENNVIDGYLKFIQESKDKNGNRVPSPSKVLDMYQHRVTSEYKKLMKKCPKITLTKRQKMLYKLCMYKVIISLNHIPPKCPSYDNEKDERTCNSWMKSQYASYKSDVTSAKRNIIELEKKLKEMVGENHSYKIQLEEEENKPLNKPFRLPPGSKKKFGVYVKNDKGNIVKVQFGDPNMEIKRDDPERLKSFRARHGCDDPGPKWKAKYWSCKFWEKKISVSDLLKGD